MMCKKPFCEQLRRGLIRERSPFRGYRVYRHNIFASFFMMHQCCKYFKSKKLKKKNIFLPHSKYSFRERTANRGYLVSQERPRALLICSFMFAPCWVTGNAVLKIGDTLFPVFILNLCPFVLVTKVRARMRICIGHEYVP